MTENRGRLEKIIAVAINPGAYEEEAMSALRRARALVKEDPSLAHPPPPAAPPKSSPSDESSFQTKISNITALLLPVLMSNLSREAYGLGMKSKIEVEFVSGSVTYILNVRCDGTKQACAAFQAHVAWSIDYFNSHPMKV